MVADHDFVQYPELSNAQLSELAFFSPHKQITEDFEAVVVKVHDGDTITLLTSFRDFNFPLRVAHVDAPELSEGGIEARDWLKNRLEGEVVQIILDSSNRVDKYGRLLGEVFHRGLNVADEMLHLGLIKRFGFKYEGQFEPLSKIFRLEQWFA